MASVSAFRTVSGRRGLAAGALCLGLALPVLLGFQAAPARAKPRGRLPSYYARVVTPQQKEQVYSIQGQFEQKIDALEAQIVALERQREEAIRALLTPEQRKQIDELTAAAEARKAEQRAKEEADEQASGGAEASAGSKAPGRVPAKPK